MALKRVSIPSPNYSSRGGAAVTTIVLHTAEGARTYQSLGSFFASSSSGVSSHVGIDDTANTVGEYVPRSGKAWTQGNANPYSVSAELCAFAAWSSAEWAKHPTMLSNCAAWIAEEAAAFGIPVVRLSPAQAQNAGVRGVCQHVDLGQMGGGHTDCGTAFPMDQVLAMAVGALPAPQPEGDDMPALPPCVFIDQAAGNQNCFQVSSAGELTQRYKDKKTSKWSGKAVLSKGWGKSAGLAHAVDDNGVDQVWGEDAAGNPLQAYWNGRAWITQGLP